MSLTTYDKRQLRAVQVALRQANFQIGLVLDEPESKINIELALRCASAASDLGWCRRSLELADRRLMRRSQGTW